MGYTREEVREMIANIGSEALSNILNCGECPYNNECADVNELTCERTLRFCNLDYINQKRKREETNMTNMLPDNTVQINPQGEVTGLDSLSLADLAKLSAAAHEALDRRTSAEEERLWNNVVDAVKAYAELCGDLTMLLPNDDSIFFDHHQMTVPGEIDCS